jgi:endonuclease/exonuclease/phosphatase family metal-dependent hydrolase
MRVATFNVENLFSRVAAFNLDSWADGKKVLDAFARVSDLLQQAVYTPMIKAQIVAGLTELELDKSDTGRGLVMLRQNRGKLLKRPRNKPAEIVAAGRSGWVGWLELKTEPVNDISVKNTARVFGEVDADVWGVVEAEHRPGLVRFNEDIIEEETPASYPVVMLIDGNDSRGIDVAVMAKNGYKVTDIRSHVDDGDDDGVIFSRDCAEYVIEAPGDKTFLMMVNHFKSKGFGSQTTSNAKRKRQADRVATIYRSRRLAGFENIIVMGDFNDTPDAPPLADLLDNTSLNDMFDSPKFVDDGHPGTFGNGNKSQRLDYLLLSPELFAKIEKAGVFRKGVWGNKDGKRWPVFPSMTTKIHQASDHAAIWADINL